VEVVASLSQGRTAAAQCGLFTHKSVPVIFQPPCILNHDISECCQLTSTNNVGRIIALQCQTRFRGLKAEYTVRVLERSEKEDVSS